MGKPNEEQGPVVDRSSKKNTLYDKRTAVFFLILIVVTLFYVDYLAQSGTEKKDLKDAENKVDYRVPERESFATLISDLQKAKIPKAPEIQVVSESVTLPPEQRTQIVLPPARKKRGVRVSNETDRQAASHLRMMTMQALQSKSAAEGFASNLGEDGKNAERRQPFSAAPPGGAGIDATAIAAALMPQNNGGDPNRQAEKNAFLRGGAGGASMTPQGYAYSLPEPQKFPLELKAGRTIPGFLRSGIHSDLPGTVMGKVSENVFDTTGSYVLIPKGSDILGAYSSQISFGQRRVQIVWNRIVFPNGTSLNIAGSHGIDQGGYSGMTGAVNEHWDKMIATAALASLFVTGAEVLYGGNEGSGGYGNGRKSPGDIAAEQAANTILEMGSKIMEKASDIQPTIRIRPGKRFNVLVIQDIVFPEPYPLEFPQAARP